MVAPTRGEVAPQAPQEPATPHVVFLLHGIRTRAEWQERIASVLAASLGVRPVPLRYGFFDVVRFLLPLRAIRRPPVERTARLMRDERDRLGGARISIVAHSFGTYVLGQLLAREPDLVFHRAVLCGCILPSQFPWEDYRHRFTAAGDGVQIVNDCGWRDVWPVLADSITWGYGSSGRFGFGHPRVRDRFHRLAHSEFFADRFVRRFWAPFLRGGTIAEGELDRPPTPWWLSALTIVRLRWLVPLLLVLALLGTWRLTGPHELMQTVHAAPSSGRPVESPHPPPAGAKLLSQDVDCVRPDSTCRVDLWLANPGARALYVQGVTLRVLATETRGTLGGVQPSGQYQVDLQGLTRPGATLHRKLYQEIEAGKSDRFVLVLGASDPSSGFRHWQLAASLDTSAGPLPLQPLAVDLPWDLTYSASRPESAAAPIEPEKR
jgi:pimeloyl-ACP methyl ester carboxylesterase